VGLATGSTGIFTAGTAAVGAGAAVAGETYGGAATAEQSVGVEAAVVKPNPKTGAGYGVNDPPVRVGEGKWTPTDIEEALEGSAPRSLGGVDLHHADQMPGSGIHEVLSSEHRGNVALRPNQWNQGVTREMRRIESRLHWWYRAQEEGAWDYYTEDEIYGGQ
jgi:hypothetical protein